MRFTAAAIAQAICVSAEFIRTQQAVALSAWPALAGIDDRHSCRLLAIEDSG